MSPAIGIVGGGIIGALTARQIFDTYPSAKVVLFEKDLVGTATTQRSAGVHFPIGRSARVREMAVYSENYYRSLAIAMPSTPIYSLKMCVIVRTSHAVDLRERCVNPGGLILEPGSVPLPISWPQDCAVWDLPGCQHADVGDLTRKIISEIRAQVTVLEGIRVKGLRESRSGVCVQVATGEAYQFDKVILAPGPWAVTGPWKDQVMSMGIRTKKIVALHLDGAIIGGEYGVLFQEEDAFLVPFIHRQHWLFSYTCLEWDKRPYGSTTTLDQRNLDEARKVLGRYSPELAAKIQSGRVFCDAYSLDWEPIVRPIGTYDNLIFVGAANGSGYRLAPAMAREAVQLIN